LTAERSIAALYSASGERLYLSDAERKRFLRALGECDLPTRLFCQLLIFTGARISEALAITPQHLDGDGKRVVFRTLKRRRLAFRAVPIPDRLLRDLLALAAVTPANTRIWPWARQTGWRKVKAVCSRARIEGRMAMPKGLRHGYGIRAATYNVPQPVLQRFLGHAKPETTAIYVDAVGPEERAFAARMW
jgi:integrase/recombinase XerD